MKHDKTRKPLIDAYLARLLPHIKELVIQTRAVVLEAAPEAVEEIKWGNPCYSQQGPVCYISVTRTHVNLGFFKGDELADPDKILEGEGAEMRHIKIKATADIDKKPITGLIRRAIELNQRVA